MNNAFMSCPELIEAKFWEGLERCDDNLIRNSSKIKLVDFPSTIKDLGQMWLSHDMRKNNGIVICRAKNPPKIFRYNVFVDAIALYVPDESVALYKANENMIKFISKNILPLSKYQP